MKQIQLPSGEYLGVKVPEGAFNFQVHSDGALMWFYDHFENGGIKLPPGNWEPVGLASELRPEQWREIVSTHHSICISKEWMPVFTDYESENFKNGKWILSATNSGLSLIRSHKMEPETTFICKKIA